MGIRKSEEFIRVSLAILKVLENRGSIRRKRLCNELIFESSFFSRPNDVRDTVGNTACLWCAGKTVEYERGALFYVIDKDLEKPVQAYLHRELGSRMDEFALYPYCSRALTPCCNLGIFWKDIPKAPPSGFAALYESFCDFRYDGDDRCDRGCGVDDDVLARYQLI